MRLFKVYIHLTKDRNTYKLTAALLITLMFVQIYDLVLSPLMGVPFSGALYQPVADACDAVRVYPAVVRSGSVQAYWVAINAMFVSAAGYVLLLAWADYCLRNPGYFSAAPFRVLRHHSVVLYWLLVIPSTDFFISIFQCDSRGYHFVDKSLQCWQGMHAFYCALYSVGLLLFLVGACLVSLLFNESRPYHLDALTRLDINQEIYITLYRVILTAVSHYTTTSNFQWITLALHLLMSAHFLKDYYKYLHYYFAEISTLFGACCLGYLWVTVNAILAQALQGMAY